MTGSFSEFHDELRTVARDMLAKSGPQAHEGAAPAPVDWQRLANAGWLGLEVPEDLDGSGATFAEVAVVLHEMGRSPAVCGYLGSVVLGVGALNLVESSKATDDLARDIASGRGRVAVALPAGDDGVDSVAAPFRLEPSGGGFRLFGEAPFVPDAPDADRLLLLARDLESLPVLVDVDRAGALCSVTEQPVVDATRRLGVITADGHEIDDGAVWRFEGDPTASARSLLDRGALAVACDSLGLAEAMMEATVAYAGVRQQFGRPIGSFQAVKHACADMFVHVAVCRELISAAVQRFSEGDVEAVTAVSMAKSYVCDAAVEIVGKAMQLHGGIGYTWESGIHAYLKRAALNRSLFGAPAAHRKRLALRYADDRREQLFGSNPST
jgi:alkylation response protein AidB-like acyl-CoA dehydrogenase